jgi:hypothetical protein
MRRAASVGVGVAIAGRGVAHAVAEAGHLGASVAGLPVTSIKRGSELRGHRATEVAEATRPVGPERSWAGVELCQRGRGTSQSYRRGVKPLLQIVELHQDLPTA